MYSERPSTALKAGHGMDLQLILRAPPLAYSDVSWVKDAIPGRPSCQIATAVVVIPPVSQSG